MKRTRRLTSTSPRQRWERSRRTGDANNASRALFRASRPHEHTLLASLLALCFAEPVQEVQLPAIQSADHADVSRVWQVYVPLHFRQRSSVPHAHRKGVSLSHHAQARQRVQTCAAEPRYKPARLAARLRRQMCSATQQASKAVGMALGSHRAMPDYSPRVQGRFVRVQQGVCDQEGLSRDLSSHNHVMQVPQEAGISVPGGARRRVRAAVRVTSGGSTATLRVHQVW